MFGVAILVSLTVGLWGIYMRNIVRHRAWMMRCFAYAIGPATMRLVAIPVFSVVGFPTPENMPSDAFIGNLVFFGFAINVVVIECIIRRGI